MKRFKNSLDPPPEKQNPYQTLADKGFIKITVPGTGIEPAHPCERQILSLLRLPIPPPGHYLNRVAILRHSG